MKLSDYEKRAVHAYGVAGLLNGIGIGFGFGALFAIAIGSGGVVVPLVLFLFAVAFFVSSKFVTAEFDE